MQVEHSRELGAPGGVSPLVVRKQQRPQFLTAGEAAELMRVSDDLIYDLIRSGEFPAIKLRNRYVVPLLALQRLEADAPPFIHQRHGAAQSGEGSWRQRTYTTLVAAHDHKLTHPDCEEYSVHTVTDKRVTPPRITQDIVCDTCGERLGREGYDARRRAAERDQQPGPQREEP